VRNFCQKKILEAGKKTLLIEAAGGVMTPINNQKTFLDLATELKIPVLLVTGNYLGAISHTLSAVEVLRGKGVVIERIIVNEREESKWSIVETLKNFTGIKAVTMRELLLNTNLGQDQES
jgi:dethiobiotin synthetase